MRRTSIPAAVKHGDPIGKLVSFGSQWSYKIFLFFFFFDQRKCPGLSDVVIPEHNKARPHTAQQTKKLCRISTGETLDHHPHGMDLAPSDSNVFAALKENLSGYRFTCDEDVKTCCHHVADGTGRRFICVWVSQTYRTV